MGSGAPRRAFSRCPRRFSSPWEWIPPVMDAASALAPAARDFRPGWEHAAAGGAGSGNGRDPHGRAATRQHTGTTAPGGRG
ncbi:hypothetical protein NUM3379_06090 [Kineococcus sp. NUM-3379]